MSQDTAVSMAATAARTTAEPLYGGAGTGRRVTVRDIAAAKARGEKWPMLTAYDALTAGIFDRAGIPVLLVGDSAAMVVYGHDSTIPVTVDDLIPLTARWCAAPAGRWSSPTCRSAPTRPLRARHWPPRPGS